jgi:hypothetical protein
VLRIQAGDHVAATFRDDAGFASNTLAFVRQALNARARVLVFPAASQVDPVRRRLTDADHDIDAAATAGRLQFLDATKVQLATGTFDPDYLIRTYTAATQQAVDDGYQGLWVSVDMTWANPHAVDLDALVRFEAHANILFATGHLTAICQYDHRQFSAGDIERACRAHPHNAGGRAFRYYLTDDRTFLATFGEADLSNQDAWHVVIGWTASNDAIIDVTGMTFLDVRALAAIGQAAISRRRLTVIATPIQASFLRLVCRTELDRFEIQERDPRTPAGM